MSPPFRFLASMTTLGIPLIAHSLIAAACALGQTISLADSVVRYLTREEREDLIEELRAEMAKAAKNLEFERAAELRDEIERLTNMGKKGR
jgi:excinuclease UvrABC helicase subunit UvrB